MNLEQESQLVLSIQIFISHCSYDSLVLIDCRHFGNVIFTSRTVEPASTATPGTQKFTGIVESGNQLVALSRVRVASLTVRFGAFS